MKGVAVTAVPRSIKDTGESLPAILRRTSPSILWSIFLGIVAAGSSYGIMLHKIKAIETYIEKEQIKDEAKERAATKDAREFYGDRLPVITTGMARNTARLDAIADDVRELKEMLRDLAQKRQRR